MLCASIHIKLTCTCAWVKEIFHMNVTSLYLQLRTMTSISTGDTDNEIFKLNVMTFNFVLVYNGN